jgi:NADH:ubiquinone oxidoreductase subunit E
MNIEVIEPELQKVIAEAIQEHGASREAIIPILHEVNKVIGYIPGEALKEIRRQFLAAPVPANVSEGQMYSVASFYHMFSTKPLGKHVVRFCESAPCHVEGGRELFKALQSELKLRPGETSPDKQWSFLTTSCLGICGVGPVILVDEDVYGNVTPETLPGILARYAK